MKYFKYCLYFLLFFVFLTSINSQQYVKLAEGSPGVQVNVLSSGSQSTTIEYVFNGYVKSDVSISGKNYLNLEAPGMVCLMEKGFPQLPIFRKSMIIPDRDAMNFKIISSDIIEVSTEPVMPSKGHFTRNIDPASVPYIFSNIYGADEWYPSEMVKLDEPYIVRDLRGMTIQFNPIQYNAVLNKLKICTRIVIEVYTDAAQPVINPFFRVQPFLLKVSNEFDGIYSSLFMNYGMDNYRYETIPEPGRLLIIYAQQYASTITPFVQWKIQRGLTVLTAEYPTQTGTGNTAIKTYIQNLFNAPEKITYIVLIGEYSEIPTNLGVFESASSDPCYVKLAGIDAYPDAFISRISVSSTSSLNYVLKKIIRYERDIDFGTEGEWYKKAIGIASNENGGTPWYDWQRMNFLRDTLMSHGWTQVDQVYDPGATSSQVITSVNAGKSVLNYIGHGSGTSWSTSGFNVSNVYTLTNGYKNPFIIDVSCLNGNFALSECLAEAWLRAGDTSNVKGAIAMYSASTNASWVPPCDMQTHAITLMSNKFKNTPGGICFNGVMKAMDLWGGSMGEGLKLMEQYHIFGDCSMLMLFGIPIGPFITHSPLPNTENLSGPYTVNCTISPSGSNIDPSKTKIFWTRTAAFNDSILLTNTTGNNWSANIPGNGTQATYRYYIKSGDMLNRITTSPGGAPGNYYSFQAMPDLIKPSITHTALGDCPKTQWPCPVSANVTDNIGIDSVWVRWYKNNTGTGIKHVKLNNISGSTFSALFNSDTSQVIYNDSIFYRVFARDNSSNHNTDSTALYKFRIIAVVNACIGTGTTSISYPFYTYYHDSRTQMIYTASEINSNGGAAGDIARIGFNVESSAPQVMNGFSIKLQHTTASTLSGFVSTGWTTVFSGTYSVPGTGWQYIDLQNSFYYNGSQNLLIEICFDNTSYTTSSNVFGTSAPNMTWHYHLDGSSGCTMTGGTTQAVRPNICFRVNLLVGYNSISNQVPGEFSLEQNYPNPFNPSTSIRFGIPKQNHVKLIVYDILGREVKTLVNELRKPGIYEAVFDGTNFASGVYFYRIEAGDYTNVKKMVLIK